MDFIKKPALHIVLIVLLGTLVYSGTFHSQFVLDDTSITNNSLIKNLGNFISQPDAYIAYPNRYIGYLTFALNYRFSGLDVTGYHIVNLAIHLINASLVYLLVILTFKTDRLKDSSIAGSAGFMAIFAATLFVTHPIETQAVTYIVQRLASLAAMFYLVSLLLFVKARFALEQKGKGRGAVVTFYVLSLLFAAMAMNTKETAFTLPLIAALYEFFFFVGRIKKRLLFLSPMLTTLLIIPMNMSGVHGTDGSVLSYISKAAGTSNISRWDYLLTQFSVVATYIRLLLLPVGQKLDYDYPISHSLFEPRTLGSFILLLCVIGAAVVIFMRSRKGGDAALRLVSFGILWFFIALSVESSVIPIEDVIFEHRVYLPSIGMLMSFACAGAIVSMRGFAGAKLRAVVAVSVVLALSFAAYERNKVWANEITLWKDNVDKSPDKARPHNNLAGAYYAAGSMDRAIDEYRIALTIRPDFVNAHYGLGRAYLAKGWVDNAIVEYRAAAATSPSYENAHFGLGNAYSAKGWVDMAIGEYQLALILRPDDVEAHYNLANEYTAKGWVDMAKEEYRLATDLEHRYAPAR